MSERKGIPLTIGEARQAAAQIRASGRVDRQYWPWVIEELCRMLENQTPVPDEADKMLDETP